jgi:hypothetical protein
MMTVMLRYPETYSALSGQDIPVPTLAAFRSQPWLPESISDALDPGTAAMYSIGHAAIDAAQETAVVECFENSVIAPPLRGPYISLPGMMDMLLYDRSGARETMPAHAQPINRPSLGDILDPNLLLTYLPVGKLPSKIDRKYPLYDVCRDVIPLDPATPSDKRPPLTYAEVKAFWGTQDPDNTPETLDARFEHYHQLSNFMMGRDATAFLFCRLREQRVPLFRDLVRGMAGTLGPRLFTANFLDSMGMIKTYKDLLNGMKSEETILKGSLGKGLRIFQTRHQKLSLGLTGFKACYDEISAPYPELLTELLGTRSKPTEKTRHTPPKINKPVTLLVAANAEPATEEPAPEPAAAVDPEVLAARKASANQLNEQISTFAGRWKLSNKDAKAAGTRQLAQLIAKGLNSGDTILLPATQVHRAEALAMLIQSLGKQIAKSGPQYVANALTKSLHQQDTLNTSAHVERTKATAAGIQAGEILISAVPDTRDLVRSLLDPEQWRYIQVFVRAHESSNTTINAINQCLEAYRAAQPTAEA